MTGVHNTFELRVNAFGKSPAENFVWGSLFRDALHLPQEDYLGFPRTREWEVAAAHYRTPLAACDTRTTVVYE